MTGGDDSVLKYNQADEEWEDFYDPNDPDSVAEHEAAFDSQPCVSCGGTKGFHYNEEGQVEHWCGTNQEESFNCFYCHSPITFANPVNYEMDPKVQQNMSALDIGFGRWGQPCLTCYNKFKDTGLIPHNDMMEYEYGTRFNPDVHWRKNSNPITDRPHPNSDFKASYDDPFDFIWDAAILKIDPILNQRPEDLVQVIRPNWNLMYSDAGPLTHDFKMPVGKVIPIVEENIDRLGKLRNRRHDQWPPVFDKYAPNDPYQDSRSGRGTVEETMAEIMADKDDGGMGLFEFPHHIEQRRIARHGHGGTVRHTPWEQALAPLLRDQLVSFEQENDPKEWVTVASGEPELDGSVSQMSVLPGLGRRGIGINALGGMLQTYGRAGDGTYSPEAYSMWNKLGQKMTEGGYGRRMVVDRPPYWEGGERTKDYIIRRKNQAGDMIYQRPVMNTKGGNYTTPPKWRIQGTKWGSPSMHPYEFDRIRNRTGSRTSPELDDTYPLELRYEGKERNPITDMKTYVAPMGGKAMGFFHKNSLPLARMKDFTEKNPDSRIAQLLQDDYFLADEGGWR